jgi:hypothetical protein
MFSVLLALRLAALTMPNADMQKPVQPKLLPAHSWVYKVRRDLREAHLFDKAFASSEPPQSWLSKMKIADDGYPVWGRMEFAVLVLRTSFLSQHSAKPVPPGLQKEINQLIVEFRKEMDLFVKAGFPDSPSRK